MRDNRAVHVLTVLLFLGVAETGGAQITNIPGDSASRQPGRKIDAAFRRHTKPADVTAAAAETNEIVLHNFASPPQGAFPTTGVIRDWAGNLYGTTNGNDESYTGGGEWGFGVVFKLDTTGHETLLHSFTGGVDGGYPNSVILDFAGNIYGTTNGGGASNAGVVFKLDRNGHETVLYSFTGGADGGYPGGQTQDGVGVILDSAGNLYGTTTYGGTSGSGVVFKLDTSGHETALYSFTGGADGAYPISVIRDSAGNLYGTTFYGGTSDAGVVFRLDTSGHETVLYSFTGGADGAYPYGGVILDSAGNLYGTTSAGGSSNAGVVFELDTTGHETVLYSFTGGADGGLPNGVIRDSAGNLYGTTSYGGGSSAGVVFKLDTTRHETVLYSFPTGGPNGGIPGSGVIRDSADNLYGTTIFYGTGGAGVVYKLDKGGHETVVYGFPAVKDGNFVWSGVTLDSAGNLYGTTFRGGALGFGVVFKLDTSGHETLLYSFTGGADGGVPAAGVILDAEGNLYGTTFLSQFGLENGVVYKLDREGHETVLYSFTDGPEAGPQAGVIRDSAGNLYGTTSLGGSSGAGVVFKIDAPGHETVLYSFTGGADGRVPLAGLIRDSVGNLYGTTTYGGTSGAGVVFKLDTSGHETVLHSFTGGADGGYPDGGLTSDGAGNLYGATDGGGASNAGVVFKLDTSGNETVLYSFTGGADGSNPNFSSLIRDFAGNLYGTTFNGGASGKGVVFKLDASGHETVLYSFTGGADGGRPYYGVIADWAGNLYGTTGFGGAVNGGVVFKIQSR